MWGATGCRKRGAGLQRISIHAPRVGSDHNTAVAVLRYKYFNPRSPCGERLGLHLLCSGGNIISIHAPRVGSDYGGELEFDRYQVFQSTLPVWGATFIRLMAQTSTVFQSTLPVWGATELAATFADGSMISIHAPRVGSDGKRRVWSDCESKISIHAPRVGSDESIGRSHCRKIQFQSTLPVWGATTIGTWYLSNGTFQSTLPVWGATRWSMG